MKTATLNILKGRLSQKQRIINDDAHIGSVRVLACQKQPPACLAAGVLSWDLPAEDSHSCNRPGDHEMSNHRRRLASCASRHICWISAILFFARFITKANEWWYLQKSSGREQQ